MQHELERHGGPNSGQDDGHCTGLCDTCIVMCLGSSTHQSTGCSPGCTHWRHPGLCESPVQLRLCVVITQPGWRQPAPASSRAVTPPAGNCGVPPLQIMHHTTAVEKKKIAVHCHAGLGRTGLAIACFLVFHGEASAAHAVEMVRRHRPGAVQTKAQVLFVSIFEQYLQHLRYAEPPVPVCR